MANPQLFYTAVASGKEVAWGTSVARAIWYPSEQPRFQPKGLRHVLDAGYRGLAAVDFDLIPGPGEGTFGWGGDFYVDSTPELLYCMFGKTYAPTGVGPYTHTFQLDPAPPSLSLEWQQNVQAYLFAGSRPTEFTLNFNARDGALTYTVQGMSKLATTTAATATSFSTVVAFAGWAGTVTVAGGAPNSVLEGSLTFRRDARPIHALNNTQDLANLWPLALQVTGRITISFETVTEYNYFLASATSATKNAVVLTFADGTTPIVAGTTQIAITMTKAAWRMATIDQQDNTYTVVAELNGVYNTTDVGPAAITVVNSRSTSF